MSKFLDMDGFEYYTSRFKPELVDIVDSGAKNVLQFNYISGGVSTGGGTTWTSNGVTFVLNSDYTITVNRNSTSENDAVCQLYLNTNKIYIDSICNGNYVLSGCPSGGSDTTFLMGAYRSSYSMRDTGNGVLLASATQTNIYIQITIRPDYSPSNLIFKPMICTQAAWNISHTFVPYRNGFASNEEIYNCFQNA